MCYENEIIISFYIVFLEMIICRAILLTMSLSLITGITAYDIFASGYIELLIYTG